ncbi:integrase catalytic subunit [Burkholderia lata]|uniref:Integrase catalytic subunit n=1 Tax=Burkholderia lata (strain ATCC 17760 / DSM 23089 / LMG 22485 / NCIMB 9086 / R18194 / 383) TaxID=482957 RepID=A0A6P2NP71_BURL3|nr:integrase catalytic subunit [Burkholderia lata]
MCKLEVPKPHAKTAPRNLAIAFGHHNGSPPHSALKYPSLREFRQQAHAQT